MKARAALQLSAAEKKRLYTEVAALMRRYGTACCDGTALALMILLHDMYGFGARRLQRLCDALGPYMYEIRRQQLQDLREGHIDEDDVHYDADCMDDAVRRMKIILKKTARIDWEDK